MFPNSFYGTGLDAGQGNSFEVIGDQTVITPDTEEWTTLVSYKAPAGEIAVITDLAIDFLNPYASVFLDVRVRSEKQIIPKRPRVNNSAVPAPFAPFTIPGGKTVEIQARMSKVQMTAFYHGIIRGYIEEKQ